MEFTNIPLSLGFSESDSDDGSDTSIVNRKENDLLSSNSLLHQISGVRNSCCTEVNPSTARDVQCNEKSPIISSINENACLGISPSQTLSENILSIQVQHFKGNRSSINDNNGISLGFSPTQRDPISPITVGKTEYNEKSPLIYVTSSDAFLGISPSQNPSNNGLAIQVQTANEAKKSVNGKTDISLGFSPTQRDDTQSKNAVLSNESTERVFVEALHIPSQISLSYTSSTQFLSSRNFLNDCESALSPTQPDSPTQSQDRGKTGVTHFGIAKQLHAPVRENVPLFPPNHNNVESHRTCNEPNHTPFGALNREKPPPIAARDLRRELALRNGAEDPYAVERHEQESNVAIAGSNPNNSISLSASLNRMLSPSLEETSPYLAPTTPTPSILPSGKPHPAATDFTQIEDQDDCSDDDDDRGEQPVTANVSVSSQQGPELASMGDSAVSTTRYDNGTMSYGRRKTVPGDTGGWLAAAVVKSSGGDSSLDLLSSPRAARSEPESSGSHSVQRLTSLPAVTDNSPALLPAVPEKGPWSVLQLQRKAEELDRWEARLREKERLLEAMMLVKAGGGDATAIVNDNSPAALKNGTTGGATATSLSTEPIAGCDSATKGGIVALEIEDSPSHTSNKPSPPRPVTATMISTPSTTRIWTTFDSSHRVHEGNRTGNILEDLLSASKDPLIPTPPSGASSKFIRKTKRSPQPQVTEKSRLTSQKSYTVELDTVVDKTGRKGVESLLSDGITSNKGKDAFDFEESEHSPDQLDLNVPVSRRNSPIISAIRALEEKRKFPDPASLAEQMNEKQAPSVPPQAAVEVSKQLELPKQPQDIKITNQKPSGRSRDQRVTGEVVLVNDRQEGENRDGDGDGGEAEWSSQAPLTTAYNCNPKSIETTATDRSSTKNVVSAVGPGEQRGHNGHLLDAPSIDESIANSLRAWDIPLDLYEADIKRMMWADVWKSLERVGWFWQKGKSLIDFYYIRPKKEIKTGKMNEDFFINPDDVLKYLKERIGPKKPPHNQSSSSTNQMSKLETVSFVSGSTSMGDKPSDLSDIQIVVPESVKHWWDEIDSLSWVTIWKYLQGEGWTWDFGSGLIDTWYIMPGYDKATAINGTSKLSSQEEVIEYVKRLHNLASTIETNKKVVEGTDKGQKDFDWMLSKHRSKRQSVPICSHSPSNLVDTDDEEADGGKLNMRTKVSTKEVASSRSVGKLKRKLISNSMDRSSKKVRKSTSSDADETSNAGILAISGNTAENGHKIVQSEKLREVMCGYASPKRSEICGEILDDQTQPQSAQRIGYEVQVVRANANDHRKSIPRSSNLSSIGDTSPSNIRLTAAFQTSHSRQMSGSDAEKRITARNQIGSRLSPYQVGSSASSTTTTLPWKGGNVLPQKAAARVTPNSNHSDNTGLIAVAMSIPSSKLFSKYCFVITGLSDDSSFTKVQLESLLKKHGGYVIDSVPVTERGRSPGLKEGEMIAVGHPKGFRKPNYLMALARGFPIVHFFWVIKCLTAVTPSLLPLDDFRLPSGIIISTPFYIFPAETSEGGVFAHVRVLNLANEGWGNILRAAGAILCNVKDISLAKLFGKGSSSPRPTLSKPDVVIVDAWEYSEGKLSGAYVEIVEFLVESRIQEQGENVHQPTRKRKSPDSLIGTVMGPLPVLGSCDWVAQSIAYGEILDSSMHEAFSVPLDKTHQPTVYKHKVTAERFALNDIVLYQSSSNSSTTFSNSSREGSNQTRTAGMKKPNGTRSCGGSDHDRNGYSVGRIVQFSRKHHQGTVLARIRPLILLNEYELSPAAEDVMLAAEQLIGKAIVLDSNSYHGLDYVEGDGGIFSASREWENREKLALAHNDDSDGVVDASYRSIQSQDY